MFGLVKDFLGVGYRPSNDVADSALNRIVQDDQNAVVGVQWLPGAGLNRTGRLAAIAAMQGKVFGLAKKGSKFKFYYRRALAGNWFAEVWSIWKSALIAAPMVVMAMSVSGGKSPSNSFAEFVMGLAITAVFLPRGLLSVGSQFSVSATIGKESYGPSGLLNLAVGVYGVNCIVHSLFGAWHVLGFIPALVMGQVYLAGNSLSFYLVSEMLGIFAVMVAGASAFWFVAFKYAGARASAEMVFNVLKVRVGNVYDLYRGSFQEQATVTKAPQIALGCAVYGLVVLGLINKPLIVVFMSLW